jgi:hypothetical protein
MFECWAEELPSDRSVKEMRATVEAANANPRTADSFAAAVTELAEYFVGLRRIVNEQQIERPALRVIPGKNDNGPPAGS